MTPTTQRATKPPRRPPEAHLVDGRSAKGPRTRASPPRPSLSENLLGALASRWKAAPLDRATFAYHKRAFFSSAQLRTASDPSAYCDDWPPALSETPSLARWRREPLFSTCAFSEAAFVFARSSAT